MLRKAAFLVVLIALACLARAQDPQPVTRKSICETSFTIPAHDSRTCTFDAPPGLRKVRLTGQFIASGAPDRTDNTIEVWIMNDAQFVNWQNQHAVKTLYSSQKVTQGALNFFLTEPGKYHLVFNNEHSPTPTTVKANLSLRLVR